jgi:hypothetical protein
MNDVFPGLIPGMGGIQWTVFIQFGVPSKGVRAIEIPPIVVGLPFSLSVYNPQNQSQWLEDQVVPGVAMRVQDCHLLPYKLNN